MRDAQGIHQACQRRRQSKRPGAHYCLGEKTYSNKIFHVAGLTFFTYQHFLQHEAVG